MDLTELEAVLSSVPNLGYPLDVALGLYMAWDAHGVMPYGGGYLEQPLKWQRLISLIERRAQAHEDAVKTGYTAGDLFGGADVGRDLI